VAASDDLGGLDRVTANERLFLAGTRRRSAAAPMVLQCECTHLMCDQRIDLTPAQYEPVRSSAARYAVYAHAEHVNRDVDRVVERQASHWVVERRSSVEELDFYGPDSGTLTSELASRVTDLRSTRQVTDDDPDTSE
jgi:hypothetical protein